MSRRVFRLLSLAAAHRAAPSAMAQAAPAAASLPRAHVINLRHRPERRETFEERVRDIMPPDEPLDYSILWASDKDDAQEAIDAGIARVDPNWEDPANTGRKGGMTLGEVGCALSHARVWQTIADELESGPDEYALVLEDDAFLSEDFPTRVHGVVSSATAHDAGFVYLAYRQMGEVEWTREKVDEHLMTCIYNWWTLGYMISGRAAAELAASSETYLQNLIPVDEYLPIVLGTRDEHGMEEVFGETRIKCLTVLGEQLARPSDSVSDTEASDIALASQTDAATLEETLEGEDSQLLTFTAATDSVHFGYQSLRRSAGFLGHTLINLGEGAEWQGYNTKLILMKEALEKVQDDKLIMFVDGYDALLQRRPEDIVERYEAMVEDFQQEHEEEDIIKYHEPVIFGAENLCWPSDEVCAQYEEGTAYASPNVYLNSGTYIGRAGLIRELLEDLDSKPDGDDQLYYSEKLVDYLQNGAGEEIPIVLDGDKILFQTLLSGDGPDWTIRGHDDDHNRWLFNNDDVIPAVLHGQGPAKHTLIGISNYVPGAQDDFYGTKRHTHVQTSDIYPLAVGLFFVGGTDSDREAQFVASIESLDIDASQTRIFVHSISDEQNVCSGLGGRYVDCVTSNETDEALARAEFLTHSGTIGARAALMADSDVIVTRMPLVQDLAGWTRPIVVGHAQTPTKDAYGTNYWTDMDHYAGSQGYGRGFDAPELYGRERTGLWQVPFAQGLFFVRDVELGRLAGIFAQEAGAEDDAVRRACLRATDLGLPIYVDNTHEYATFFGAVEDEIAIEPGGDSNDSEAEDGLEQSDSFSGDDVGGMTCVPNDLLHASLAILVTGAGSSDVNGCYQFNGRNGMAWQFELGKAGRTFEIFKDDKAGWWNIQERVQDSYPNPSHYAVESDDDDVLPPSSWGVELVDDWVGKAPIPNVQFVTQKTCLLREEENSELTSDTNNDSAAEDEIAIEPTADEIEQSESFPGEIVGGDIMSLGELLDASLAILVTGAGSSEVNGCYQLNGRNGLAWQFELINSERAFELFKVEGTGWWNILERVGEIYPNPAHYGAKSHTHSVLPPGDGWGKIQENSAGYYPAPNVEFATQKDCLSWEETNIGDAQDEPAVELAADGNEQSESFSDDGAGDEMSWGDLLHASLAVLVTGAGSSEVNGCYQFNGINGMAWQFEHDNGERTFELFKVEGTGWWNILERVRDSYPNPVHYGVEGDDGDVLPPSDGSWGSVELVDGWVGKAPLPKVEVTVQKACLLWEESNGELTADSNDCTTCSIDEL